MSHQSSSSEFQNLLSAVTDALLAGEPDIDSIIDSYNVQRSEVDSMVSLIRRLHMTLVGQQPSRHFVRHLKADLMGTPGWNVVTRVRRLPARVQIAAAIALVAGFMFITRRALLEDAEVDEREIPVLQ